MGISPRMERLLRLGVSFTSGEAMLQVLQAVNGLLLVWLLSVEDFAVYAVFTAAMGFASHMLGFGIAPTIISLVGTGFQDKEKVGRYLMAGSSLRLWMLLIVSPLGLAILWFSSLKIGLPVTSIALLSGLLVGANYLSSQIDLFCAPLQMLGRVGTLYRCLALGELVRILLTLLLWVAHLLSVGSAVVASVIVLSISYGSLLIMTRSHFLKPCTPPLMERQQLIDLVLPSLPNALFGAFQGQIMIFISAMLGNTQQIAAVGALGRLARLVSFLSAANPMIVGPAFAKMSEAAFWRRLPFILLVASLISCIIAFSGFFFPELLIKIIGEKYRQLASVVWLVTLGSGLVYFLNVLGTMRTFRRWVAWWASFATILLVLAAQSGALLCFNMETISGVLMLGIFATLARIVMVFVLMATAKFRPSWLRSEKPPIIPSNA
jgi:O-antigen/teichoic acid export membrane protein